MRKPVARNKAMTQGERAMLFAYLTTALFGVALAFVVAVRLGGAPLLLRPLAGYDVWLMLSGGLGAGLALHLVRSQLGRPGLRGLGQAVLAAISLSFLAALIGGTLALPFYGTMFGPFTLITTLAASPLLATLWFTNIMLAHVQMIRWHDERDSIFRRG